MILFISHKSLQKLRKIQNKKKQKYTFYSEYKEVFFKKMTWKNCPSDSRVARIIQKEISHKSLGYFVTSKSLKVLSTRFLPPT